MMEKIKAFISEHPYKAGAAVLVGIILFILIRRNSSSGDSVNVSSPGTNPSEVAAGTQLAMAQVQANVQNNQITAAANVQNNQTNAQLTAVGIQAQTQQTNDTLSAQTAQIIANLQATTQQYVSNLSAQVSNHQTDALVQISLAPYTAAMHESDNQLAAYLASQPTNAALQTLQNDINTIYNGPGGIVPINDWIAGHGVGSNADYSHMLPQISTATH